MQTKRVQWQFWLIISIILFFQTALLTHIRFTAWPEMLTYPWLMMQGYHFYGDIIHPYVPFLPYFLTAIFTLFGLSITNLQIITWIVIFLCDLLVYRIAMKLGGKKHAAASLLFFVISQIFFEGNGLWFDLVSLVFVLAALDQVIQKKVLQRKKAVVGGLFLGVAVLTKLTNLVFLLPVGLSLYQKNKRQIMTLLLGFSIPLGATAVYFALSGQGEAFIYWGIWYPIFVMPRMWGFQLFPSLIQLAIIAFWFSPILWLGKKAPLIAGLFLTSLIFAFPRFAYFHLQHTVAFVSLLLPFWFVYQTKNLYRFIAVLYFLGISVLFTKYIVREWNRPVRFWEPEVIKTRAELTHYFSQSETVYFLNVPANLFVGTNILPVKPWVDTFPWYLERPGMQEKLINNFSTTQHILRIPFNQGQKYELGAYRPEKIVEVLNKDFRRQGKIGTSDIEVYIRKTSF